MPIPSTTMTVRLPIQLKEQLEQLSEATQRSRSWLATDAIRAYLELQMWQIAEIQAGLAEADAGDFATPRQVARVLKRWGVHAD